FAPPGGDRDRLTEPRQGFGAAVVPERILEGHGNDRRRGQPISQVADALLEADGSFSRIDELALRCDPEDRLGARQDGLALTQEGEAAARGPDLDTEEPEPFQERILRQTFDIDRAVMDTPFVHKLGEYQAHERVPPRGVIRDHDERA